MSKLDTKQFSLIYDSCNLNTLIRNLVAQFKLTADQVQNHMDVDFGLGDSESELLTDETRLMQIFSNLIVNALRYTKNGAQAVKDIRKTKSKIPIIALTAYAMEDDNKKLLNEGFDALLTKPFSKDEITTLIKKHL